MQEIIKNTLIQQKKSLETKIEVGIHRGSIIIKGGRTLVLFFNKKMIKRRISNYDDFEVNIGGAGYIVAMACNEPLVQDMMWACGSRK